MHYRIVIPPDPFAAQVLEDVRAWLSNDKEMQRDRKRLVSVCCSAEVPIQLQGAPIPASLLSA
jgi:hypothetical protein